MSARFTHVLELNQEKIVTCGADEYLALVDQETYPAFVGIKTDPLDLMTHLQDQANALTAFSWRTTGKAASLRLVLTNDHRAMERITFSNRPPSASGTLRTHGTLCLVGHDRLLDCARNAKHALLKGGRFPKDGHPHALQVPPGIFYVLVYHRFAYPHGDHPGYMPLNEIKTDYTVFLHHYPHPPPRVAPVRLTGGLIPWAV